MTFMFRIFQMKNLRAPIVIKLGARTKPDGRFGSVKNIMLENISAEIDPGNPDAGSKFPAPQLGGPHNHFPIVISGLPDHALQNISLKNITLTTPGGNGNPAPTIPLYDLQKIPRMKSIIPSTTCTVSCPRTESSRVMWMDSR